MVGVTTANSSFLLLCWQSAVKLYVSERTIMVVLTLWGACLACSTILLSLLINTGLAPDTVYKQPLVDIYHQMQQARALNYM